MEGQHTNASQSPPKKPRKADVESDESEFESDPEEGGGRHQDIVHPSSFLPNQPPARPFRPRRKVKVGTSDRKRAGQVSSSSVVQREGGEGEEKPREGLERMAPFLDKEATEILYGPDSSDEEGEVVRGKDKGFLKKEEGDDLAFGEAREGEEGDLYGEREKNERWGELLARRNEEEEGLRGNRQRELDPDEEKWFDEEEDDGTPPQMLVDEGRKEDSKARFLQEAVDEDEAMSHLYPQR